MCCDANQPLPFTRETFSLVVLADAFPYIWHKRLLAEETMRLSVPDGVIVMPHLHSALGENFSAGNTLTPSAYRDLFAARQPRLFSDELLLTDVLDRRLVDLTRDASPADLGAEPSFTLIAGGRGDLFRRYELPTAVAVAGELRVNPLYRIERHAGSSILTLTFPTPEYEEEFGACRRYLPDTLTVDADLTGTILPGAVGIARRRIATPAHHYRRAAALLLSLRLLAPLAFVRETTDLFPSWSFVFLCGSASRDLIKLSVETAHLFLNRSCCSASPCGGFGHDTAAI